MGAALKALREDEKQGLAVAICRLEAAIDAILSKRNLVEENQVISARRSANAEERNRELQFSPSQRLERERGFCR